MWQRKKLSHTVKSLSGQVCLWIAVLPPFPTNLPTIPCYNNWVLTQPIRCQGFGEASLDSCFWGTRRVSPTPPSRGWDNGRLCFLGREQGSVSVVDRNKRSLSSFTSVPNRDVFRVAQRKQGCPLWETDRLGNVAWFCSPDHWRLRAAPPMLYNPFKGLSTQSQYLLIYLSLPESWFLVSRLTLCATVQVHVAVTKSYTNTSGRKHTNTLKAWNPSNSEARLGATVSVATQQKAASSHNHWVALH